MAVAAAVTPTQAYSAYSADAQCRLYQARLRKVDIDRDEQDARAAAGLRRRRHETPGGTNMGGHKQTDGQLSSAEAVPVPFAP